MNNSPFQLISSESVETAAKPLITREYYTGYQYRSNNALLYVSVSISKHQKSNSQTKMVERKRDEEEDEKEDEAIEDNVGAEEEEEDLVDEVSQHATSVALSETEEETSEIDPDKMGPEGIEFKMLTERKSKLLKTAEILAVHDVVVQKLINKARDDLGELTSQKSYF